MYVFGLDCGGTKTQALLATVGGEPLGLGRGGAANYTLNGVEGVLGAADQAMREALNQAGLDFQTLQDEGLILALGVSGAGRPQDWRALKQAWLGRGFTQVLVRPDAAIALLGALSGQDGVVVIAGTGSIAYGVRRKQEVRVGGWGYLLGDEGSAFRIALRALQRVMQGWDGRVPRDLHLETAVLQYFKIPALEQLVPLVYKLPLDRGALAGFSKTVTALAQGGHGVCQEILREAGQELARLALAALEKLQLLEDPGRVGACGGVFKAGDFVLKPMQKEIWGQAPRQKVTLPDFEPVVGAVLLGIGALNFPVKEAVDRLRGAWA